MNGNEMFNLNENVQNVNGQLGTGSQLNLEEKRAIEEEKKNEVTPEIPQKWEEMGKIYGTVIGDEDRKKLEHFLPEENLKKLIAYHNEIANEYEELLRKEEALKKLTAYHDEVASEYRKIQEQEENVGRSR